MIKRWRDIRIKHGDIQFIIIIINIKGRQLAFTYYMFHDNYTKSGQ